VFQKFLFPEKERNIFPSDFQKRQYGKRKHPIFASHTAFFLIAKGIFTALC